MQRLRLIGSETPPLIEVNYFDDYIGGLKEKWILDGTIPPDHLFMADRVWTINGGESPLATTRQLGHYAMEAAKGSEEFRSLGIATLDGGEPEVATDPVAFLTVTLHKQAHLFDFKGVTDRFINAANEQLADRQLPYSLPLEPAYHFPNVG